MEKWPGTQGRAWPPTCVVGTFQSKLPGDRDFGKCSRRLAEKGPKCIVLDGESGDKE
jgi:hypothetical protein